MKYDLIVIGAGPGGYVAAIRAAQLKLKVAIIEKEHLGGICLNWGCIPTKTLLRSAEVYLTLKNADKYGLSSTKIDFDINKIVKRSRDVANQLTLGIKSLLKKNKVNVYEGYARLLGNKQVIVKPESSIKLTNSNNDKQVILQSEHIILATGARAKILPGFEPDGEQVITYREAMVPKSIPDSLIIVGSGAIGMEFASFYNAFGCKVTVLEVQSQILPNEDEEISKIAFDEFTKSGIEIKTGVKLINLDKHKDMVEVNYEYNGKQHSIKANRLLMAIGIIPNTENLGLELTKVGFEKNYILTNKYFATDEPGLYAIGDITPGPWLAHKASHEAITCVEKIAGLDVKPINVNNIPGCTYSIPQIASIGISEKVAKNLGKNVKIGRFPFVANGKAITLGEFSGLAKTIFDADTGELLGAHLIGPEVTELISSYTLAKNSELVEADFMHTIFAHPTLSEVIPESVLAAFNRVIHF